VAVHCYDDSTINTVVAITITIINLPFHFVAESTAWNSEDAVRKSGCMTSFKKHLQKVTQLYTYSTL